jgi:fibronectin-binding autotransporter adhesin
VFGPGNTAGITNGSNGNLTGLAAPALFLDGLSATNGGPTPTVALLPASPAFNRGTNLADLATDQRGQPRVSAGSPDAGAYELIVVESALVTTTNDEFNGTSDARFGTGTSLREAVYCTASPVDVSSNLTGQTLELTMVGDTQFGNSALLFTNPSARTIRAPFAPRTTLRVNSPVPMRHFRIAPGGAVSLQFITLAGGQATNGGAIYNQGTLFVSVAALVSNTASGAGGAVFVESNAILRVTSSTLSGNSAGLRGGAVANRGTNSFQYATLAWNRAASGGGAIYNEAGSSPSTLNASIVAANTDNLGAPSDIGGPSSVSPDSAYNLIGTGGSGGLVNGANSNLVGVADPGLAPLGDYGGRSPTVALYPWSPAIDGSPLLVNAADQRGYLRIFPYDIGAYELLRSTNVVSLAGLKRNGTGGGAGALEFDFAGGVTGATFSVYATTNAPDPRAPVAVDRPGGGDPARLQPVPRHPAHRHQHKFYYSPQRLFRVQSP